MTRWSLAADRLGRGAANWRTQAIMHKAMHDALNAAAPRYARWAPPAADEPPADGAAPLVAMAAAAYQVLLARHPEHAPAEADALFREVLRGGAGPRGGRRHPPRSPPRSGSPPWRGTPRPPPCRGPSRPASSPAGGARRRPSCSWGSVGDDKPMLFGAKDGAELRGPQPPGLDTDQNTARPWRRCAGWAWLCPRSGRTHQEAAAYFWAYQSSQRGFVHLAAALMAERPLPGGAWD